MNRKQPVQYTLRDIPENTNARLREVAAELDISLNQAAIRALERGLGLSGEQVAYRSLAHLVSPASEIDRKAWTKTLAEQDHIHPDDWT